MTRIGPFELVSANMSEGAHMSTILILTQLSYMGRVIWGGGLVTGKYNSLLWVSNSLIPG